MINIHTSAVELWFHKELQKLTNTQQNPEFADALQIKRTVTREYNICKGT